MRELVVRVRDEVRLRTGTDLVPEVVMVGFDDDERARAAGVAGTG